MKTSLTKNPTANLSTQIKKVIGYRILICFFLAISVVFAITVIEIASSSDQLAKNIEEQCKTLKSFVISQALVENEDAIQPKLDDLNQKLLAMKFYWNSDNISRKFHKIQWNFPLSWTYYYQVKNIDGTDLGYFQIKGSLLDGSGLFSDLLKKITLLILFFVIIFTVLYPLSKRIPQQLFITPINDLLALLRNEENQLVVDSFPNLPEELNEIKDKITALLKDAEKQSHEAALGQIAMQVAHDIRSPLIVLNVETTNLPAITEHKRISIRDAIQRVNDIANNLLSQYNKDKKLASNEIIFQSEPVTIMLESVISEKRVEISNTQIRITHEKYPETDTLFANVDVAGFKRALSNIINNSIEAVADNGLIVIKLRNDAGRITIQVIDNGHGIPKDQLPLILAPGVTFGKTKGSGLGLPYTIDKIYSWNGNYSITSEINEGTTFELILPQAQPASWFASNIYLPKNGTIIVLDDDEYIHNIWDERLKQIKSEQNMTTLHFHTPEQLESYCEFQDTSNNIFLIDYELFGHKKNGLFLVEKLRITKNAILVTSRYEDQDIRENCQRLGMQMIPKLSVMNIPIKIIGNVDLIFIDDDESITDIWKERANILEKNIEVFNDIHDFMKIFNLYKKDTLIYIDSSLGAELKGEDYAKVLYDNGYRNLFIATGYSKQHFNCVYWAKGIVDKYPPF